MKRSGVLVAAVAAGVLAGCTQGSSAPAKQPQEAVAAAANALAETSGVTVDLQAADLPTSVAGLVGATGLATKAPAFKGTLKVSMNGSVVEVPVVSVGGKVHAKLPLTTTWSVVDPKAYGTVDPAALMSPTTGLPAAIKAMTGATAGSQRRGGADNSEVLTEYTGTIPGAAMKRAIPSASGDSFATKLAVTDGGQLREASFTGVFYPNLPSMTYTLKLTGYGATETITAP